MKKFTEEDFEAALAVFRTRAGYDCRPNKLVLSPGQFGGLGGKLGSTRIMGCKIAWNEAVKDHEIKMYGSGLVKVWRRPDTGSPSAIVSFDIVDFRAARDAFMEGFPDRPITRYIISEAQYDKIGCTSLEAVLGCPVQWANGMDSDYIKVCGKTCTKIWVRSTADTTPEQPDDMTAFTDADFQSAHDYFVEKFKRLPSEFRVSVAQYALRQGQVVKGCIVQMNKDITTPEIIKVVGSGNVAYWERGIEKKEAQKEPEKTEEPKKPKTKLEVSARAHFRSRDGKDYIIPPPKGEGWNAVRLDDVHPPFYVTDTRVNDDGSLGFMLSRIEDVSAANAPHPSIETNEELICVNHRNGVVEAMEWQAQAKKEQFQCIYFEKLGRKVPIIEEALPERYHDRQPLSPEPPPSGVWLGGHTKPFVVPKKEEI